MEAVVTKVRREVVTATAPKTGRLKSYSNLHSKIVRMFVEATGHQQPFSQRDQGTYYMRSSHVQVHCHDNVNTNENK